MGDAYAGQLGAPSANNLTALVEFVARQALGLIHTATPVKIIAVHGGGVGPAPTVDVQPLVNMVDGLGKNSTPHETVYGILTTRTQGGKSAIINDPVVGDIGWVTVPNRDISKVKSTADVADPDSFRRFSLSDGCYQGATINKATPTDYIQHLPGGGFKIADRFGNTIEMGSSGITITSSGTVTIKAPSIAADGAISLGGAAGSGVAAAMLGTVDTGGYADITNLATKVKVT